jgi:hypothetical protein
MLERLISGDNHIDLTYCPPDLWSSQAPSKWKLLVPRVEELEDGCHWFVEAQDRGMWNGVGPGFLKRTPDLRADRQGWPPAGSSGTTGRGQPRPTTPECAGRPGPHPSLDAEVVAAHRDQRHDQAAAPGVSQHPSLARAADFAKKSDPNRIYPLAIVPNNDPQVAAAGGAALRQDGPQGRRPRLSRCPSRSTSTTGTRSGRRRRSATSRSPSLHRLWAVRAPDTPALEQRYMLGGGWCLLALQLDTMEYWSRSSPRGVRVPDFVRAGRVQGNLAALRVRSFDTEYEDRARGLASREAERLLQA